MLQCLKQNKNSELMDPKCKQMITKRQITQNTGNEQQGCCLRPGCCRAVIDTQAELIVLKALFLVTHSKVEALHII